MGEVSTQNGTRPRRVGHLRFALLGSGSRGNGLLVECGPTAILVDCGFTLKETERRLARLGREAGELSAILVTHEHGDHADGIGPLARKYGLPVWLTTGTHAALGSAQTSRLPHCRLFGDHEDFAVDALAVHPYTVPHDAREPCQFVFSDGTHRLGLLTDAGHITPHIETQLSGCDALILECNHDSDMLAEGPYSESLKQRVGGPLGHLNNDASAALLASLDTGRLQHIVAAHLSEKNNTPWLVRSALGAVLGGESQRVEIASQEGGLAWRELV
jgi:phosphoribosyl 1,2-cyclic phosphodiesterase